MLKHMKRVIGSLSVAALCLSMCVAARADEPEAGRKIVKRVAVAYPAVAKKFNLSGTVKLMVTVGPDGAVTGIRTLGGNPMLAIAAEESVRQWKYEAGSKESKESVAVHFDAPQ
jgi:TonB family protein